MSELSAFTWPDLSRWKGLPEGCTLASLREVLDVPPAEWLGAGYLGESAREYRWLSASSPVFPNSVRVWLSNENVVLMDTEILGEASDLEPLVAKLGAPASKLDAYFGNARMPESEWVYPDRGLTLYVEPETHSPLRVVVYPATTLDIYKREYRLLFRPAFK